MKRIIPCVVITLIMVIAGIFLPVFGFLALMLCPLPLAVLGCIEGHKNMSIAEFMIEGILFVAISPSIAIYYLLACAPLAGILFLLSKNELKEIKKYTAAESLLLCVGISITFKLILILGFWIFTKQNILFPDVHQMNITLNELYGNQPELQEAVRTVLSVFPYLLPTMLVLYATIETFLNYALCSRLTKKLFPNTKNFPPELPEFKVWKFPVSLLLASIFALVAGYFIDTDTWFWGAIFIMNLQIVISALMFVQGLSMALWIMDGFKLKRATKILIFIILSFPFFWPWLIVIGMCELALNLRDRIKFKS